MLTAVASLFVSHENLPCKSLKVVLFSSKLDSLRARSWDQHISPTDLASKHRWQAAWFSWDNARQFYCQTDLSHRLYWRCSSFFWAANAIIPSVNHHYFAAGFCMIVAIDCLFWSLCAKTCRMISQGIQLDIELSPQLVAVFNAKQICKCSLCVGCASFCAAAARMIIAK